MKTENALDLWFLVKKSRPPTDCIAFLFEHMYYYIIIVIIIKRMD